VLAASGGLDNASLFCLVALTPSNDTCCAHSTTFREYQRKQVQPLRKVRRWSAQGGAARRILATDTNAVPVSVL
jgi:hypothetical protein